MKPFRYKKYVPATLGKILFFEDIIPKEALKQQFISNLFGLLFCFFGAMICVILLYWFVLSNDFLALIFGLFFSLFFYYGYEIILNFFIVPIDIVCDKGLVILYLNKKDKMVKSKIFYFDANYVLKIEDRRNLHIAGRYRYTYDKIATFFDNNKKVFQIHYSFAKPNKSSKKEFFEHAVLAFETFRITRN